MKMALQGSRRKVGQSCYQRDVCQNYDWLNVSPMCEDVHVLNLVLRSVSEYIYQGGKELEKYIKVDKIRSWIRSSQYKVIV